MALKIDLEKAYYKLKLEFIRDTLIDLGCPDSPESLVNIVWCCISTPSMTVLWNGEVLEGFSPERGIHQGDPLSPYLFVLCLEHLLQLIFLAEDHHYWKPI